MTRSRNAQRNLFRLLLASTAMATLAACGGGGGGGGGDDGADTGLAADDFRTQEFQDSTGLEQIRAAQGFAQITGDQGGEGVIIAVLDDGLDEDHPDIAPNLIADVLPGGQADRDGTHGTAVAAIAVGDDNGTGTQGVAFNAGLVSIQVALVNPDDPTEVAVNTQQAALSLIDIATGGIDADIINMSFGLPGTERLRLDDGTVVDLLEADGNEQLADFVDAFEGAMELVADAGKLMVIAAGNGGGLAEALEDRLQQSGDDRQVTNVGPSAPARSAADVGDGVIVAIAVDENNELTDFSQDCFGVETRCMAAPGVDFNGALIDGETGDIGDGTSYSAPLIAGAAAVVQAAFPGTTPQEAGNRLLSTATDLGAAGTDSVFGRGLLNLENALAPQGNLAVATGTRIDGAKADLSSTAISLGSGLAFGGFGAKLLDEVVVLDDDNFPFGVDLSDSAAVQSRSTGLEAFVASTDRRTSVIAQEKSSVTLSVASDPWLDDENRVDFAPSDTSLAGGEREAPRLSMTSEVADGIDVFFGLNGSSATDAALTSALPELGGLFQPASFLAPFDQIAGEQSGGGAAFALGENSQLLLSTYASSEDDGERTSTMQKIELVHKTEGDVQFKLGYGFLAEDGGYIGSSSAGAFGSDSGGQSHVLDFAVMAPITDRLSLFGSYTEGRTAALGGSGLISDVSTLRSSAFGAGLVMKDVVSEGDGFSFMVGQPIRVNGGSADLTVPTGRTEDGGVTTRSGRVDLTPSSREVAFEAVYDFSLSDGQALSTGSFVRLNPDHEDGAEADVGFGLNYKISF